VQFKLKEDAARPTASPADVIASVLAQSNNNVAVATDTLLSFGASAAASTSAEQPARQAEGPLLWEMLPRDCKLKIAGLLSSRDLALAATLNREFAGFATERRMRAKFVQPPHGLSLAALTGMLEGHPHASKVGARGSGSRARLTTAQSDPPPPLQLVLTRMAPDLRHIVHFEDLSRAIAAACDSPKRIAALTHLQLRRCEALDHVALAELLTALPAVQEVDVAECAALRDDALVVLSQHLVSAHHAETALGALSLADEVRCTYATAAQQLSCLSRLALSHRWTRRRRRDTRGSWSCCCHAWRGAPWCRWAAWWFRLRCNASSTTPLRRPPLQACVKGRGSEVGGRGLGNGGVGVAEGQDVRACRRELPQFPTLQCRS